MLVQKVRFAVLLRFLFTTYAQIRLIVLKETND